MASKMSNAFWDVKRDTDSRLARWWPYFAIILAGSLLYLPTLSFGLSYFDDHIFILERQEFLRDLTNVFKVFRTDTFLGQSGPSVYYRPLLNVSLILDAQFGKTNPFIYHLTNINFHLLVSCLVYLLLMRLGYGRFPAFVFAFIFTVHPVSTQTVAWIPGRTDSLLAVFILLCFLCCLKLLETKKWLFYFIHLLFFAFSIFTKETAFILPLLCLLYLGLIFRGRQLLFREKILPVGWFLIGAIWFLCRKAAFANPMRLEPSNLMISFWNNLGGALLYLGKTVLPVNLSVLPILQDSSLIYGLSVLISVFLLILFSKRRRNNFIYFGLSWFMLFLLPSFIRPNPDEVVSFMEYRAYLPLLGFIIVLLETDLIKTLSAKKTRLIFFAALVVFFFSAVTFNYSKNFKTRLNFWKNAVNNSPHSPLARRNLGAMYYLDGRLDEAEAEYKKSLQLNPNEPMAHNNLGLIYAKRGMTDKAEEEYRKELEINPNYDDAHYNLGLLCYRMGDTDKAVQLWKRVLELNPDHTDARKALAAARCIG